MLRSLLRFSIRDVLWLTVVVALALGWLVNRRQLQSEIERAQAWRMRAGALEDMLTRLIHLVIELFVIVCVEPRRNKCRWW